MGAAEDLFDALSTYGALEQLVTDGEVESQHLECKSPGAPNLKGDMRAKLAEAVSGFANSGGGVIIWGASTTHHDHSGLDVISQLEPIGTARLFGQMVDRAVRAAARPTVTAPPSRVLRRVATDTKGVVVTLVPAATGDPVQSTIDSNFYLRSGDSFAEMPYEILRRMFLGSSGPDLRALLRPDLVSKAADGKWTIPITIDNQSTAVAEDVVVVVTFLNPEACAEIVPVSFIDQSAVNPGMALYTVDVAPKVHRGLNRTVGRFHVKMRAGKFPKRVVRIQITLHANRMRERNTVFRIQLAKKGFSVTELEDRSL